MYSHNLPAQLTSLIGREQEIATLRELLQRPNLRLVTITGPFGVGKTSLSLAVAYASLDIFADGVFLVSLAAISDHTLIIPTIAQTLNVSESPRRLSIDVIKDYLNNREMLLAGQLRADYYCRTAPVRTVDHLCRLEAAGHQP